MQRKTTSEWVNMKRLDAFKKVTFPLLLRDRLSWFIMIISWCCRRRRRHEVTPVSNHKKNNNLIFMFVFVDTFRLQSPQTSFFSLSVWIMSFFCRCWFAEAVSARIYPLSTRQLFHLFPLSFLINNVPKNKRMETQLFICIENEAISGAPIIFFF